MRTPRFPLDTKPLKCDDVVIDYELKRLAKSIYDNMQVDENKYDK